MKFAALLLALCAWLTGCSSVDTHKDSDLTRYHRIYVEHRLNDNHRTDELIVAELKACGFEASCGPLTMLPDGVDAILTYDDRWTWDFKSYLIEFSLELRANFTGKPLATGHFHQGPARTVASEVIIHQVITPLFRPH